MDLKIFTKNIEDKALKQINTLLEQPAFKNCKVRIMPDVHAGAGCVIGFTANLGDKVIPNIVGVDIGCGMHVVKLGKVDIDLVALDRFIHENIPAGFNVNNKIQRDFDLTKLYCYKDLKNVERLALGIGSLGGGNHFIEIDVDEEDNKYLVIHTGSRNLGKQVACIYQDLAVKYCKELPKAIIAQKIDTLKTIGAETEISKAIKEIRDSFNYSIPKDLCYLEGLEREQYLHDMKLCQEYAVLNREVIASKIVKFIVASLKAEDKLELDEFESIHNYIDDYNMVRKGAISARLGQRVIIPLNMKDGSIIAIGKGNSDWNLSGPHGAGRVMSRGEAKRTLKLDDFKNSMKGIFTTTVNETTIDEAPMVYKPAQEIIDAIKDTVEIKNIIKPIYNFKAGEE